jgi:DNA-binding transcriptional LysR family regulator
VDRTSRPAALTEAGHTLARHGRALLHRLEDAEHELAEVVGRRGGRLRLGSFPTALATFVPAALARFRALRPGVQLSVVDEHMQALLPRLVDGELDVALCYDHPSTSGLLEQFERVTLFDDPFTVVVAESHPLARARSALDLSALRGETLIGGLPGSAWFRIVRDSCRNAGFEPEVGFASDDYRAVQAFAAAGLGVAVVPGLAAAAGPVPGTTVRPLRPGGPSRRVQAVRASDAYPTAASLVMMETLAAVTASFRPPAGRR